MATRTIQSILKSHQDLAKNVGDQMKVATTGKIPGTDFALREQDTQLKRLKVRVADLRKARDAAVKRYETEIRTGETRIAELEKRVKEGREVLKKKSTGEMTTKKKVVVKKKVVNRTGFAGGSNS